MNKSNLRNYKTYIGVGLTVIFLVAGISTDIPKGFFKDLISAFEYLTAGIVFGYTAYYVFLEERSY